MNFPLLNLTYRKASEYRRSLNEATVTERPLRLKLIVKLMCEFGLTSGGECVRARPSVTASRRRR